MKKKIIAALLTGMAAAGSAQAFEMRNACKTIDKWTPAYGQCDATGLLQGRGVAYFRNLLIFGNFVGGLPEGRHRLVFNASVQKVEQMVSQVRESRSPDRGYTSFEEMLMLGVGNDKYHKTGCDLSFVAGEVASQEISCSVLGYDKSPVSYTVTPFDGKVRIIGQARTGGRTAQLEMDLPSLTARGDFDNALLRHVNNENVIAGQLKGRADRVAIAVALNTNLMELVADNATVNFTSSDPKVRITIGLNGTFDLKCTTRCKLNSYEFGKPDEPVDTRFLQTLSLGGKSYTLLPIGSYQREVFYFKGPDGLEFDGAVANCVHDRIVKGGSAQLLVVGNGQQLDIKPLCGTVTMPDGRKQTGQWSTGPR